jgi:hypothetical protein
MLYVHTKVSIVQYICKDVWFDNEDDDYDGYDDEMRQTDLLYKRNTLSYTPYIFIILIIFIAKWFKFCFQYNTMLIYGHDLHAAWLMRL